MGTIHSLRQLQAQQAASEKQAHRVAVMSAVVAFAAGDGDDVDQVGLLSNLRAMGLSLDVFEEAVAVQSEIDSTQVPDESTLAELKKKAASLHGSFWASVQQAKRRGIRQPVESNGPVVKVIYEPLRGPHAAMREAKRSVEQAERAAFRVAELQARLDVLLGARSPEKAPSKPTGGAWSADDTGRRSPEDPSVIGHKVLRRDREGRAVVVTERPIKSRDVANVHVIVRG